MGFDAIQAGSVDVAIVGGAEAAIIPLTLAGFQNMRALSRWEGDPSTSSRPFDANRTGMVLESLAHASRRGAKILAEVTGFASTTDVHHITAPSPDGEAAARCMTLALEVSGLAPQEVDHINAHGTGTPMNDAAETLAIRSVFGPHADRLMVSSTKGASGHMLGAAGGFEAVVTVRALETGWVPPTLHLETPDPRCDLDYVAGQARQASPNVALSNAFGFGGANAVVVFRRWEDA
jgi:3-oxoacyl-[acyl-carrier-protein] synthase II